VLSALSCGEQSLAEFGKYRTQMRVMAEFERLAAEFSDRASKD